MGIGTNSARGRETTGNDWRQSGRPARERAARRRRGRIGAPRGARPIERVCGADGGRISIAGVVCYRPGDRPHHLYYQLRVHRRHKGEPKGFAWTDYRVLIIAAHQQLGAPVVW